MVNMSGFFTLVETENYVDYLMALELPFTAASHIQSLKSENISIEEDGEGASITTHTPWITKTINFKFDEPFSVDYGNSRSEDKSKGVLNYFCKRPQENIINCKSKEKKKGWKIVFDWIFTENSLVNKSLFITKNIGMTKKYRRLAA